MYSLIGGARDRRRTESVYRSVYLEGWICSAGDSAGMGWCTKGTIDVKESQKKGGFFGCH